MPSIPADKLNDFAARLLVAAGVSQDEARLVAESLVGSNLRGHDSHGVMRIPFYVERIEPKQVVPGAELSVILETPTILRTDGNWGFGQTQSRRLTERLIEKARASGVVVGTLIHAGHVGRLGEYVEQAAAAGLVAMAMANNHGTARRVAPPGGTAPRLGTNPIAFGIPRSGGPLILDFGTSVTAEGKVRVRKIAGQDSPDGWLLDSQGRPTNDSKVLYANPPGTIRPMGGDQAYKGFGLALVIEIIAGGLSGGVCAREVPPNQSGNCLWMMVIDPAQAGVERSFAAEVEQLLAYVVDCPRVEGVKEITLPGEPERRTLSERSKTGVPLDDGNWAELTKLAQRLGVAIPS